MRTVPTPPRLQIELIQKGLTYSSQVNAGQTIAFGESLATTEIKGGLLELTSPVSGQVIPGDDTRSVITIEVDSDSPRDRFAPLKSQYATSDQVRETIAKGGLWSSFKDRNGDIPAVDGSEVPKAIIVNFVVAEPFRARGRVILTRFWDAIIEGIRFLPRLLSDYGKVEIILTAVKDPVAQRMYKELSGFAWTQLHPVPVTYPIENPGVLASALAKSTGAYQPDDIIWYVDGQGIAEIGELLTHGKPPHRRILALGGPGIQQPIHVDATIGTPVAMLIPDSGKLEEQMVLRGGLLTGQPVDPANSSVNRGDDAFFFLPEVTERQLFTFIRPGFDRASIFPAFAGNLTRTRDRHINASLRGELRPCISCGACEKVCPASLLPQVLHRYLHRDMIEEAVKMGLDLCIDCGLCTYVCPSKIELQDQFAESRKQLREEGHEENDENN
ncbi:MAG: 4Fe-4S dicluster domain-containing protein [Spirochaetales bacterium]|nr:4Fe-4S dicluster domain-containing protein [Spirochaetales bacterium]